MLVVVCGLYPALSIEKVISRDMITLGTVDLIVFEIDQQPGGRYNGLSLLLQT